MKNGEVPASVFAIGINNCPLTILYKMLLNIIGRKGAILNIKYYFIIIIIYYYYHYYYYYYYYLLLLLLLLLLG